MQYGKKANCWEYQKCGREAGGANVKELGTCPAYPDNGRRCWRAAGTLSDNGVEGTHAKEIESCEDCIWYKNVKSGIA